MENSRQWWVSSSVSFKLLLAPSVYEKNEIPAIINVELCSSLCSSDTCEEQTGIQHTVPTPSLTSENAEGSEHTAPSELFIDSDGHLRDHTRLPEMQQAGTKSCLVNRSKEQARK